MTQNGHGAEMVVITEVTPMGRRISRLRAKVQMMEFNFNCYADWTRPRQTTPRETMQPKDGNCRRLLSQLWEMYSKCGIPLQVMVTCLLHVLRGGRGSRTTPTRVRCSSSFKIR